MSELKKCPFCGWEFAEHAWNEFGEEYRVCDQCGASSGTVDSKWDWQSRPIEDAINARIAELEEENDRLQSAWFEDETICPDGSLRPKVSTLLDRIAELEGLVDELIEAGDAMSNAHSMWVAEEDKWDALVKDWEERER